MDELPLDQAFILNGVIAERYGMEPSGPTFNERRAIAAMQKITEPNG